MVARHQETCVIEEKDLSLEAQEPNSFLHRPLKFEVRQFFEALTKGTSNYIQFKAGKPEKGFELAGDIFKALASVGFKERSPEERLWILLNRALAKAFAELIEGYGDFVIATPEITDCSPVAERLIEPFPDMGFTCVR